MSKFCANIAFLFTERPFLERYRLAAEAGFKAVETGFPLGFSVKEVADAKTAAGVQQVLINIYTGDVTKGELGFAALPGKEEEFKTSLATTLEYAKAVGARKIHIMSGKVGKSTPENDTTYENNLRYAASVLEKEKILGLIEPINNYTIPGYYMNSYEKALSLVRKINNPHLKIMLDVFHLQQIRGGITEALNELSGFIGHVQVAQVPGRNEPDTPGEINYPYVLKTLERFYSDWIGLEYKATGDVKEGLKWIQNYGYNL